MMRLGRKLPPAVAILLLAVAVLATCGPRDRGAGATINLNLDPEPATLDPGRASDTVSARGIELLFLGLTDLDDRTSEVRPELATRWEPAADGLVWTFYMRNDVYWVHYDPATERLTRKRRVTAYDVEYGVRRTLDPQTASQAAHLLHIIKNGQAYNRGALTDPKEVGVRALNDHTIQFTLEQPAGYLPAIAAMWVARPVPREPIERFGYRWAEPGNLWTNGPYVLQAWEHASRMVKIRNPFYYDASNVQIGKITWAMVADSAAALAMYEKGDLDVSQIPESELGRVKADPVLSRELAIAPEMRTHFFGLNQTKPPFDNRRVRQAFSLALDRQGLVNTVLRGGQRPAKSLTSPGVFGSPADDPDFGGAEYDPAKARRLLLEAGFPGGRGLPEITLAYNASPANQRIAEFAQQSWREVLGVQVKLSQMDWEAYLKALASDPPQIYRLAWSADYPDANNWLRDALHSTRGENRIRWRNPEFDRLVDEAAASNDPARRKELYREAERILIVAEAAIIPLYHHGRVVGSKPYVQRTYAPHGIEQIDRWRVNRR